MASRPGARSPRSASTFSTPAACRLATNASISALVDPRHVRWASAVTPSSRSMAAAMGTVLAELPNPPAE